MPGPMEKGSKEQSSMGSTKNLQDQASVQARYITADRGREAFESEHKLSLPAAIKKYRKAVFWSFIISMTIVMEGYDTALIGNFYAYPTFKRVFGTQTADGYAVSAPWQVGLTNGQGAGVIIGVFINGILTEMFGHKRVILVSLVLITGLIFITFFAKSMQVLVVGEVLCGIPWGVFSTMGPAYASEVCPVILRGYLTTYINLCWVIGQLVASGVLAGLMNRSDEWSYRIPFAIQWVWPLPLFVIICFAPDSPWWLVRKGRLDDAERSLKRLASPDSDEDLKEKVAMMVHTVELEREIETGSRYVDCFRGVNLRRTEISCMAWLIQILAAWGMPGYATFFLEQAGLSSSNSFDMNVGMRGIGFLGTVLSWFLVGVLGRRTIYLGALISMAILMFVIAGLGFISLSNSSAAWALASLFVIWVFAYDLTIGPLGYAVASETSATSLRSKTIAVARNAYNLLNIVTNVSKPYMLSTDEANWGGKVGFFVGGLTLLCFVWVYFRLPETKGRTYEELDILFEKRVPARKFKSYNVNPYSDDHSI